MSKHKVHQHSFSNYAVAKKSSPLIKTQPWTNPYQQKNDQVPGKPAYIANPPSTEEWQKNNILQRVIETRQAELQQQAIQAKLTVGEPGDKYEQEADAMASQVMSMSEPTVQKESEQKLQTRPLPQRVTPVIRLTAARNGRIQAKSNLESRLNSSKGGGSPLPNQVRSFMEPRFGADFSQVRVHTDTTAVQMSRELGAQAFTHGSDIYYGEGKAPGNNELTAHELTHVVQQTQVSTSIQKSEYSSPALQMRSQESSPTAGISPSPYTFPSSSLPTSSPSRTIIQRAVTTWGGEWDTTRYNLMKASDGRRGADIVLKFTPSDNVDAELIGLTQSVQSFVNNQPNLTPAAAMRPIPPKDAININTGVGETDQGTAIDQSIDNHNPLYAVEDTPLSDTNIAETLPVPDDVTQSNGWGKHGFRYTDKNGALKTQSAVLVDDPSRSNAAKNSRQIFETSALAIKGNQAGTYYGSVRWGWRTDDQGNMTKIPLTKVSDGVPSSTFMKAAEVWNASKLPVKVTTAPIKEVYNPKSTTERKEVPANTNVIIIPNSDPKDTSITIKVIEGEFNQDFLTITPADLAKLKDAPLDTLDLPIVDVKVTNAPITEVQTVGIAKSPLQIPTGTRVQIVQKAKPPSTNGKIKVIDGEFTGKTLEIPATDMVKLRDERS